MNHICIFYGKLHILISELHMCRERYGDFMASYVAPAIKEKFDTLSIDLKDCILERNVHLNDIHDLIRVLEEIVEEGEAE